MMEFEFRTGMANLMLADDVVAPERDVVLEEAPQCAWRPIPARSSPRLWPPALFVHFIPTASRSSAGCYEIEALGSGAHALDYYKRFYTPENAILVVAGDGLPRTRYAGLQMPVTGRHHPARSAATAHPPSRAGAARHAPRRRCRSHAWSSRCCSKHVSRPLLAHRPGGAMPLQLEVLAELVGGWADILSAIASLWLERARLNFGRGECPWGLVTCPSAVDETRFCRLRHGADARK